jgi:hypothetical protein
MSTKNNSIVEKAQLELTDAELENVCGGSHFPFNPFTNNFNNSNFSSGGVIQIASANGYANRNDTNTSANGGITNAYGNGGTASNDYSYRVGYFSGQ